MTTSIRILTTSTLDSSPSLLLVSPDGTKTLVNCGEGCQRSFLESSSRGGVAGSAESGALRVSAVDRVCLTHMGHDAAGGLPGMILTTADVAEATANNILESSAGNGEGEGGGGGADAGSASARGGSERKGVSPRRPDDAAEEDLPGLEILGPRGTRDFLRSLRHFMRRDRFRVTAREGAYRSDSSGCGTGGGSSGKSARQKKRKKKKKGGDRGVDVSFRIEAVPFSHTVRIPASSERGSAEPSAGDSRPPRDGPNGEGHIDKKLKSCNGHAGAKHAAEIISYLFTTPPIQGKFLPENAKRLGLPPGPSYRELKSGQAVTFVHPATNEERTIQPHEVVTEGSPGVVVAVIYCPTMEVLDQMREAPALVGLKRPEGGRSGDEANLDVMIHIAPKSVFWDERYREWIRGFGANVDHITLFSMENFAGGSEDEDGSPFHSAALEAMSRSLVHAEIFPTPFPLPDEEVSDSTCLAAAETGQANTSLDSGPINIIRGQPLMEFVLIPRSKKGLNVSTILPPHLYGISSEERRKLRGNAEEVGAIGLAQKTISEASSAANQENELGELIFTGTGSSLPCKHRNVTGKYLRMNNGNAMLLDVGEGTVGQLLRVLRHGRRASPQSFLDEVESRIRGIKAVWISHPHADHHLGLLRLLAERAALCRPDDAPLLVMAPPSMFRFLSEYEAIDPRIRGTYEPLNCWDMQHGRRNPAAERLRRDLGVTRCVSVPVAHCPHSYALVMDGTAFGGLSYSGDCRPSQRFADIGRGSDLLIHEATFEDGMEQEAVLKRHSTVGEALSIARRMGAKSVILTHFSQRYPRIPPLRKAEGIGSLHPHPSNTSSSCGDAMKEPLPKNEFPVVFAFDFMSLRPHNVSLAAELTPALRLLYPDFATDEEGANDLDTMEKSLPSHSDIEKVLSIPGMFSKKGIL